MINEILKPLTFLNDPEKFFTDVFRIDRTIKTPLVILDKNNGLIVIAGNSVAENTSGFYEPLIYQLRSFSYSSEIKAYFCFDYCGSSTGVQLLHIVRELNDLFLQGIPVEIFWYQEEETQTYADGALFRSKAKMPFHLFELTDDQIDEVARFFARL